MSKKLVLFDFDGTLTRHDSLWLFLRFATGKRFYALLPFMVCTYFMHKCGFFTAQQGKEKLLAKVLCGKNQEEIHSLGEEFTCHMLEQKELFFRTGALGCIENYKKSGADIYIISASPSIWIAPMAKCLGVQYICTEFFYENDIFWGKFLGKNCNGEEKVRRIEQEISHLAIYKHIVAYGDSKGDLPMLSLAHEKHFQPFRGK